ncbi:MAG: hypothetical protein JXC85_03200 [Candidatus Aenigmarchaeota archaeon]|nr:hypothetical protein [Candidatus Aenigmarchaeota archaeon]
MYRLAGDTDHAYRTRFGAAWKENWQTINFMWRNNPGVPMLGKAAAVLLTAASIVTVPHDYLFNIERVPQQEDASYRI